MIHTGAWAVGRITCSRTQTDGIWAFCLLVPLTSTSVINKGPSLSVSVVLSTEWWWSSGVHFSHRVNERVKWGIMCPFTGSKTKALFPKVCLEYGFSPFAWLLTWNIHFLMPSEWDFHHLFSWSPGLWTWTELHHRLSWVSSLQMANRGTSQLP